MVGSLREERGWGWGFLVAAFVVCSYADNLCILHMLLAFIGLLLEILMFGCQNSGSLEKFLEKEP